jgi:hypothetical protein
MTVSSVDTAELPRVRPQPPATPVLITPPPELPRPSLELSGRSLELPGPCLERPGLALERRPAPTCRAELRAARRHQRRQRRLYAFLGLSILGATLVSTVVVLDVVR